MESLDEELGFGDFSGNDDFSDDGQFTSKDLIDDRPRQQNDDISIGSDDESVSSYAGSDLTPEEEDKKKILLLSKLKRLQKKGYALSRAYNIDSPLEDIQAEVDTIKREANLEQGTKVAKNVLISICSVLEYANNRFDPMDIVLDGWSEEINEDVENGEYDEVMEELYDKYYDKVQMSPELKLLMMVGGSAVKFHLSHTLLKSMIPGADSLLQQNPNLKNDIMNLVNKTEQGQALHKGMNNLHIGNVGGLGKQDIKEPDDVDDILAELESETNNAVSNNKIMQQNNGVVDLNF